MYTCLQQTEKAKCSYVHNILILVGPVKHSLYCDFDLVIMHISSLKNVFSVWTCGIYVFGREKWFVSLTRYIPSTCLEIAETKHVRHFSLMPTAKVFALPPKEPLACGSIHALSYFLTNMKVQFNLFDRCCLTSGLANFCHSDFTAV